MNILLLNPFHTGSHQLWAENLRKYSKHPIELWTLKGKYWKWRMHGAAVSFAQKVNELKTIPDLIICTDMMDVTTFKSLTYSKLQGVKVILYFHENQISYPWFAEAEDKRLKRDMHYGFINYTSALAADEVWFNSNYHRHDFLSSLKDFLKVYPDERNLETVKDISVKSKIMYLGCDLKFFDSYKQEQAERTTFLWNHRHEHDKNPDDFFNSLIRLSEAGEDFDLIVLGESYANSPEIFSKAKEKLEPHIIHWGHSSREEYASWLWKSTCIPVTSKHDFFGQSVVEAVYCNTFPILPNRLTYPEHFQNKEAWFYNQASELDDLLYSFIKRPQVYDSCEHLLRYDWSRLILEYDRGFEALTQSASG